MDDLTPTPDSFDELISAALDGEATMEERAQIAADAARQARLADFTRVQAAVRDLDDVDDAERERSIAAALDAFTPAAAPARPVDLDARRRQRAERSRRFVGWIGAAAAVAVLGVVVANLNGGGSDSDSASLDTVAGASTKVAADESITAIDAGAALAPAGGAAETTAAAAADTTAAAADSTQFAVPAVASVDELKAFVSGRTAATTNASVAGSQGSTTAEALPGTTVPCTLPGGAPSEVAGPIIWQGTAGVLLLAPDAIAPTKAVILSADCTLVLTSTDLP